MMSFLNDALEFLPILAVGIQNTLLVTLGSLVLSTGLGLVWAIMRLSKNAALSACGATIVNVLRSIPIIVQLFYIYFVLPEIGVELTALQAAIIGLGIAYSAYQAEDFRAGIQALDRGQIEAAESLNMSYGLMMRRVILPQAVKIILPSYGNTTVMMLKDSSLASTITVGELSLQGKLLAASTFQNTTVFTLLALLYLVMCGPLMLANRWLERRMSVGRH
ncbi:amino acid ABC transporter permease [Ensifer aridi]|uniref:amino acid ABC transporter permease n=1 Tax=Ensifer aridi TaxID=1708715 RepID=UPI000A11E075|nr:amino acid ABC transporter permease [Ensifer aridi]